ncbi:MAG: UMP kinase [Oscillospiraceae bacterium]
MSLKYKRVLLKLSGEALAGEKGFGLDFSILEQIAYSVKEVRDLGCELAIVIGGGIFWRGRSSGQMDRTKADQIGMLGTVMNAIAFSDTLNSIGVKSVVQTARNIEGIAEPFCKMKTDEYLKNETVVIFGGGTGNPYFSTDTTSSLKACEISADVIFKATMVDGVYDSDPKKNSKAQKFDEISFKEVLNKNLCVMDITAAVMCLENNIPILVFNLSDSSNIVKAIKGEKIGTLVK